MAAKPEPITGHANVIGIVSSRDNTQVTIEFPKNKGISITFEGRTYNDNNNKLTATLNRYNTMHLKGSVGYADLSGTKVTGTNVLAVFSGANLIQLGTGKTDHMVEQMVALHVFGKNTILAPIPGETRSQKEKNIYMFTATWSNFDKFMFWSNVIVVIYLK